MAEAPFYPETPGSNPIRMWGFWAIVTGALALMTVSFYIYAPTLDPQPSAAQTIGEIAGEMKRAAWRSFLGLEPELPEPLPARSIVSHYLPFAGPALGLVAIILSVISLVRKENRRLAAYGTALGAGAVLFQIFWWMAALIVCAIIFIKIIENLDGFFTLPWE